MVQERCILSIQENEKSYAPSSSSRVLLNVLYGETYILKSKK